MRAGLKGKFARVLYPSQIIVCFSHPLFPKYINAEVEIKPFNVHNHALEMDAIETFRYRSIATANFHAYSDVIRSHGLNAI